jgi:hypothetical protein
MTHYRKRYSVVQTELMNNGRSILKLMGSISSELESYSQFIPFA